MTLTTAEIANVIRSASNAEWTKEPIALVTLTRGRELIQVPEAAVATLVGAGWSATFDPTIVVDELDGALKSVIEYARKFARGVMADGVIDVADESDGRKAQMALTQSIEMWNALQQGLHSAYPVAEAAPVAMVKDGQKMNCDPNQAAQFEKAGWKRAS